MYIHIYIYISSLYSMVFSIQSVTWDMYNMYISTEPSWAFRPYSSFEREWVKTGISGRRMVPNTITLLLDSWSSFFVVPIVCPFIFTMMGIVPYWDAQNDNKNTNNNKNMNGSTDNDNDHDSSNSNHKMAYQGPLKGLTAWSGTQILKSNLFMDCSLAYSFLVRYNIYIYI